MMENLDSAGEKILLSSLVQSSSDAIISKNLKGIITSWNPAAERIFGYTAEEIIGKSILTLIPPDRREEESVILQRISQGEKIEYFKTVRIKKNGEKVFISVSISPIKNSDGTIIGASKIARDITPVIQIEAMRELLSSIINSSDDAIISKNLKGIITSWNPAAERIFGYHSSEIIGKSILLLFPSDRLNEESLIMKKIAANEKIEQFETVRLTKDRKPIQVSVSISPIKDSEGFIVGASKIVRDITELNNQRYMANHDALTGLPSSRFIYYHLELACHNAEKNALQFAVLFIDIDGFKLINDSYGHIVGDVALIVISDRLKHSVRKQDKPARVGGDEFIVLLDKVNNKNKISHIATNIIKKVTAPISHDKLNFSLGISMGIACYPKDGTTKQELLRNADISMYSIKKRGKNGFEFYS